MRNLVMFLLCCGVAAAFGLACRYAFQERAQSSQEHLFRLGAPQAMEASSERALLSGDFVQGLRENPEPQTYEKLAALFLVTHNLKSRTVVASAFHEKLMGRVIGESLEFFDQQARMTEPGMRALTDDKASSAEKTSLTVAQNAELWAEPPWLLYRDSRQHAAFRWRGDELEGFVHEKKLSVDEDDLVLEDGRRWNWSQAQFEEASSQDVE